MMHDVKVDADFGGALRAGGDARLGVTLENYWTFRCLGPDGEVKWQEDIPNIVVTVGKNDILNQEFTGSAYTAAWFIGIVDGGSAPTYAAADTMGSHAGWTENTGYSQATRPAWSSSGAASAGSIVNTAATFSINATSTLAGGFLTTVSTKGGTTGTLYGEANFTQGNRSVTSGDTLLVTVTLTAS